MKEEIVKKLYESLFGEFDKENYENDLAHDYITENKARNGKVYYWYYDGDKEAVIDIETKEIITDEEDIEKLFC